MIIIVFLLLFQVPSAGLRAFQRTFNMSFAWMLLDQIHLCISMFPRFLVILHLPTFLRFLMIQSINLIYQFLFRHWSLLHLHITQKPQLFRKRLVSLHKSLHGNTSNFLWSTSPQLLSQERIHQFSLSPCALEFRMWSVQLFFCHFVVVFEHFSSLSIPSSGQTSRELKKL